MDTQSKPRLPEYVEAVPGQIGIPDVVYVKRLDRKKAEGPIWQHTHPANKIEFIYLARGLQTHIVNGRTYKMKGGDVLVIFPGERHSSGDTPQEKALSYWVGILVPKRNEHFLGLSLPHSRVLLTSLKSITPRHFAGSPALQRHLDELIIDMSDPAIPHGANRPLFVQSALSLFLLEALVCAHQHRSKSPASWENRILALLNEPREEPLTVNEVAERLNVSLSSLNLQLKKETGVPPAEYILRYRLAHAQRMLVKDPGKSVTEIAHATGFSSGQNFATAFKRFTGITPRQMRNFRAAG